MAYLGNAPARSFISFERQVFTIVNSQTAYTLSHSVTNENDIRLVVNNIVQEPGSGKAYTASGTTLTLSAALTNGTDEMYCVFLGRATATNAPGAGSVGTSQLASDAVTEAKIADDAVESEHLNNNVISGQTALGATPADTDEFLVSDAGTIKRVDYSYIKSANTPAFHVSMSSNQSVAGSTHTVLQFNTELFDTDSAFNTSNYKFTPQVAGKYFFGVKSLNQGAGLNVVYVKKNGSLNAEFQYNGNNITTRSQYVSTIIEANGSSDYFEASVYHNDGSNKDYYSGVNNCQFFGFLVST
jgi:hypothetical protein